MNITLINDAPCWRRALAKFTGHECYHTWDFHEIDTSSADRFFAIEITADDGQLFLPVIARSIPGSDLYDTSSVYGYPGPLHEGPSENFPLLLNAAFEQLRDMGFVSFFSRCSAFSTACMPVLPPGYIQSGKVITIDLSPPADVQWRHYRDNLRRDISRANEKGLQCEQAFDNAAPTFLDLYHRTMSRVAANSNYYFDKHYLTRMLASRDFDCRMFVCKHDQIIIAAALFIFCNGVVQYHLSGSDDTYSKIGATKVLIDHVRRLAAQEGFSVMNLGGGLGGREDQLYNFKRGFSKTVKDFYLIKKVLNPAAYNGLLASQSGRSLEPSNFFPAYRQRTSGK